MKFAVVILSLLTVAAIIGMIIGMHMFFQAL